MLINDHQLDKYMEELWFIQGLPREVGERVLKKSKISREKLETIKIETASEKLIELLNQEEQDMEFFNTTSSKQYTSLASAYQPPLPKKVDLQILTKLLTVPILLANMDSKIDALTE